MQVRGGGVDHVLLDDLASGLGGASPQQSGAVGMLLLFILGFGGCELDPFRIAGIVHHRPPDDSPPALVDAWCTSPPDSAAERNGSEAGSVDEGAAADALSGQVPCRLISAPNSPGFCVPAAPFNWSGPGKLMMGDSPDHVPACPADSLTTFASGTVLGTQRPTCQGCTCGAPKDLSCGAASIGDYFWDPDCIRPCSTSCFECGSTCAITGSACANHGALAMNRQLLPAALLGGSCTPSSAAPDPPPVVLARAGRACLGGLEPPFCSPGETCTATTGKTCLFHMGEDLQCPRGPYTERSVFYGRTDDSRACSCSCDRPKGVTCPTRIEVFSNGQSATCTGTLTETFETAAACLGLERFSNGGGGGSFHFVPGQPSGAGECAPGGTETGTLAQGLPFTACCIPDGPS